MFNQFATQASKPGEPSTPQLGPAPDPERAQQPALPGPKYLPYAEKPASEPTYKPYAENPAPDEQPYEPYKDI